MAKLPIYRGIPTLNDITRIGTDWEAADLHLLWAVLWRLQTLATFKEVIDVTVRYTAIR